MSTTVFFHAETTSDKITVKGEIETHTNGKEKYGVITIKQESNDLYIFLSKETAQRLADEVVCMNGRLNE